jgi:hypothetical protein
VIFLYYRALIRNSDNIQSFYLQKNYGH